MRPPSGLPSASRLDLVRRCAASWALPHLRDVSDAADDGNDLHAYAQAPSPEALARLPERLREHAERCARATEGLRGWQTEVALGWTPATSTARAIGHHVGRRYGARPGEVVGSADWVSPPDAPLVVVDLKTGRLEPEDARRSLQLGMLALAEARLRGVDSATVVMLWVPAQGAVRHDEAALDVLDLAGVEATLREVVARIETARRNVADGVEPYLVGGGHCDYCPALLSCPRTRAALGRTLPQSQAAGLEVSALLDARDVWAARERVWGELAVWKRARGLVEAAATQLADAGQPVTTPEGKQWRKGEVSREVLDGMAALSALSSLGATVDEAAQAVEASTTKAAVGRVVKLLKARGVVASEAEGMRQVLGAMREAGGIATTTREEWGEW